MRTAACTCSLLFLGLLAPAIASAGECDDGAGRHFLGNDSVDSGSIFYEDGTQWDSARQYGILQWDYIEPINWELDNGSADLSYGEYYANDGTLAYWSPDTFSPDDIEYNNYYFPSLSAEYRRATASHENGHALGIGDHCGSTYDGIVMYYAIVGTEVPKPHDKSDYHAIHGY